MVTSIQNIRSFGLIFRTVKKIILILWPQFFFLTILDT